MDFSSSKLVDLESKRRGWLFYLLCLPVLAIGFFVADSFLTSNPRNVSALTCVSLLTLFICGRMYYSEVKGHVKETTTKVDQHGHYSTETKDYTVYGRKSEEEIEEAKQTVVFGLFSTSFLVVLWGVVGILYVINHMEGGQMTIIIVPCAFISAGTLSMRALAAFIARRIHFDLGAFFYSMPFALMIGATIADVLHLLS
ncbi:hypothetical protein ACPV5S_19130 [Vibrio astriarenae]